LDSDFALELKSAGYVLGETFSGFDVYHFENSKHKFHIHVSSHTCSLYGSLVKRAVKIDRYQSDWEDKVLSTLKRWMPKVLEAIAQEQKDNMTQTKLLKDVQASVPEKYRKFIKRSEYTNTNVVFNHKYLDGSIRSDKDGNYYVLTRGVKFRTKYKVYLSNIENYLEAIENLLNTVEEIK